MSLTPAANIMQVDAQYQKPTIVGPKAGGGAYEPAAGPLSFQFQPGPDAEAAARRKNLPDWLRAEIEKRQIKAAGEEGLAQLTTYITCMPACTLVKHSLSLRQWVSIAA